MKRYKLILTTSLAALMTTGLLSTTHPVKAHNVNKFWAVLIAGYPPWPAENANEDVRILRDILIQHYTFEGIFWRIDATNSTVHSALTNWLATRSNLGDLVFIYLTCHGGGYNVKEEKMEGGRIDLDGDEGPEIYNETSDEWFSVDECLVLHDNSTYWDDQMRLHLANIEYGRMIVFISTCAPTSGNSTGHCFGGGFIDDISGPRRIIITSANETWYSYFDPIAHRGWFDRYFIDALNPDNPDFDIIAGDDGAVSIEEAYWWGWVNDPRIGDPEHGETPWLDDNGDRLPTFKNGTDYVESMGLGPNDRWFARLTWLNKSMYSGNEADVNNDGCVDITDIVLVQKYYGGACKPYANEKWNPLVDVNYDDLIDLIDLVIVIRQYGWHK